MINDRQVKYWLSQTSMIKTIENPVAAYIRLQTYFLYIGNEYIDLYLKVKPNSDGTLTLSDGSNTVTRALDRGLDIDATMARSDFVNAIADGYHIRRDGGEFQVRVEEPYEQNLTPAMCRLIQFCLSVDHGIAFVK